jgi:hypothetical protein
MDDLPSWSDLGKQAAKVFIDYSVLGVVVLALGSPLIYILWQAAKEFVKWFPQAAQKSIILLDNAIANQGDTAKAVKENTIVTGKITDVTERIAVTMDKASIQLSAIAPRPGHTFSTAELEEFALVALRGFRTEYVDKQTDPAVKERLNDLCDEARDIFARKLRESR